MTFLVKKIISYKTGNPRINTLFSGGGGPHTLLFLLISQVRISVIGLGLHNPSNIYLSCSLYLHVSMLFRATCVQGNI